MANRVRGEVTVNLDGQAVRLRPTFDAIARAEEGMGRGIMSVLTLLQREDMRLKDVVEIVHACGVGLKMTREQVAEAVMREGLGEFVTPVAQLVIGVVGGAPKEDDPSRGTD